MSIAQKLYESGKISYMRTDSFNLSNKAIADATSTLQKLYWKEYILDKPRVFTKKSRASWSTLLVQMVF